MVIFFTKPPMDIPYPYILGNQFAMDWLLNYIKRHYKHIKLVLLDSGVEKLFKKPNPPKDYPDYYESMWYYNAKRLVQLLGKDRVIVVIPDYPDDYVDVWKQKHALWLGNKCNIERTVENIIHYWDKYHKEFNLMIPLQGYYEQPLSVTKSIVLLNESGILKQAKYFGIANLCSTRKSSLIIQTCKHVRGYLQDKWLHVFGASLKAIRQLVKRSVINSYDSTAYTFPRTPNRSSCRSERERIDFFIEYLNRLP